ncbi:MAG: EpsG family protein [Candidatus Phocaeicola faecipullorum]|nr:EpsG family protein [Candidatus Phocaeicola faecipullorum]
MLLSLIIYPLTAIILYFLANNLSKRDCFVRLKGGKLGFWNTETILSLLVFGFIAGARYNVGVDHLSYLEEYLFIQETGNPFRDTFESGFLFIAKLFAGLDLHYFFFFAFWAILQIGFIYYALRDRRFLLPYIALLIMLGPYFLNWMNGIRQCVVMCLFVVLIGFIVKRKFIYYAVGILLAALVHKSALILLPLYFIFYKEYKLTNRRFLLLILCICIILGMFSSYWLNSLIYIDGVLSFLGYDAYAESIYKMTSEGVLMRSFGPSRLIILITDITIIWFYPDMKKYMSDDKYLPVFFFLFLLGTFLSNLFINTSHIFLRPIEYFTIFRLPMTAYLLYYLKKDRSIWVFLFFSVIIFSYIFFSILKAHLMPVGSNLFTLYNFFFTK